MVSDQDTNVIQQVYGAKTELMYIDKLQSEMNSAALIITSTLKFDRSLLHVRHCIVHWLDVPERVTFWLCLYFYKCLHGMGSPYLSEMC